MSKKISLLTLIYTIFILLLFLSGSLTGVWSEVVYLTAFVLPCAIAILYSRKEGNWGENYLTIQKEKVKKTLPLVAPTVSVIICISFVTSVLIYLLTGRTNNVDVGDSLVSALITHALLPAILEEAIFRYIPMRLLAAHSRRGTVLVSAFFFSLAHHDLFSIPYAFIAGVIFMAIDIATDSVIPSVLIHFINNALSVGMLVYDDNVAFAPTVYVILGILTLISLVLIYKKRDEYREMVNTALDKGEGVKLGFEMLLYAAMTLSVAVISLL